MQNNSIESRSSRAAIEQGRETVFLIDPSPGITGAFKAAQNITRALAETHRVVLVLPVGSTVPELELAVFSEVRFLRMPTLRRSLAALTAYGPLLLASALRLRLWLAQSKASVLHINDFYLLHGVLARGLGFRGRIVIMIRMDPWRFGRSMANFFLKSNYRACDAMVAVSRFIQSLLPAGLKTVLLYDPVVNRSVRGVRVDVPAADRHRIVCIANYTPGKGQDDVLAAFLAIAHEEPDLTLEFHGGDLGLQKNRDWHAVLERKANASPHARRITFRGFAEDTEAILCGAIASANCSHSESFSLSVLEASAAGLPVIATNCGGPAEILVDEQTGYLVPVGDVAAIGKAILAIARDRGRAAQMGAAGHELVRERFSEKAFRETLLKLYDDNVQRSFVETDKSAGHTISRKRINERR